MSALHLALALRDAFEAGTLPPAQFGHRAHLTVALLHLRDVPPAEAVQRMRTGLLRYLAAIGAPAAKYHETRTRAWLQLVAAVDQSCAGAPFGRTLEEVLARLGHSDALKAHYSDELLATDRARATFVAPDRAPLPSLHAALETAPGPASSPSLPAPAPLA